ncbi:hypothetical protein PHYBLDRAFT_172442 [Phycomyces blakesleeanus NRRL 1555(-)]|uniref:Uncharacterized protein n=1 Tax=Phycomyces blakesleeanus (strain ATCC 8743b / DSM 1359 / FGSC 10004 / NBRC 33097 / NRRL 1555) TaxID=763407 RepID=A0A167KYR4_PHYB8|nr:hypothetical protein PHYBLDRAFT_172442 [Phycomyces blakesleeanus NRRL 1555(-)]OAD69187.1 hypothetical protein PHYBLDRAFT_172442 [Phycomyces blakesleeanus NRRL 1555(-)]|eukprot:XP_018287227.1 hypothetical protein PHYBLDRAFT_172442 [Phycomyces blakesleeanus NRRL 1555(-)]
MDKIDEDSHALIKSVSHLYHKIPEILVRKAIPTVKGYYGEAKAIRRVAERFKEESIITGTKIHLKKFFYFGQQTARCGLSKPVERLSQLKTYKPNYINHAMSMQV